MQIVSELFKEGIMYKEVLELWKNVYSDSNIKSCKEPITSSDNTEGIISPLVLMLCVRDDKNNILIVEGKQFTDLTPYIKEQDEKRVRESYYFVMHIIQSFIISQRIKWVDSMNKTSLMPQGMILIDRVVYLIVNLVVPSSLNSVFESHDDVFVPLNSFTKGDIWDNILLQKL